MEFGVPGQTRRTIVSRSTLRKIGLSPALLVLCLAAPAAVVRAQTMSIEEYEPKSTLVVPEHHPAKSKFPFIDVHNRQDTDISERDAARLVAEMDRIGMRVMVNLSGESGAEFAKGYRNLPGRYPGRFVVFANVDFAGLGNAGWGERAAAQLAEDVKRGARGLKIYKNLGMSVVDSSGRRVAVDDPELDPVWSKCAELKIPVLIHTARTRTLLRRHRLHQRALARGGALPRPPLPGSVVSAVRGDCSPSATGCSRSTRTPPTSPPTWGISRTTSRASRSSSTTHPNVYPETAAVLAEYGRQPRTARAFFIKYQDRILFGKDSFQPDEYPYYWRTFETGDEYFDYYRDYHAFWKLYGMELPDDVLKKLYYKNALHVIPGIDPAAFPP